MEDLESILAMIKSIGQNFVINEMAIMGKRLERDLKSV
jgi:hypothetical protein